MLCAWCEQVGTLGRGKFMNAGKVEGTNIRRRSFKCEECLGAPEMADARVAEIYEGRIEVLLGPA